MNMNQDEIDWHIVHEAVSDAIDNAEGKPSGQDLQRAFKKHGLLVLHEEDAGALPEREIFWLIERKVQPPQYTTEDNCQPGLSSDPWRAARYATEREAFDARLRLVTMRDECTIIEHVFINKLVA